ncbi:hypothetical protein [Streptoalloteichus tenebrarius]|uniref:hypothetical protein n=1 Tax=Streptoalloteichus tenebrarius (strain ATCC 17920 / DSM 40477 / JCM 4838 / CBS 697.72 / NBRC 16177 / NCIMB 11028 / NRRL B-12390 / A12253. 1 / ISP 5477) TaxID=1933 RepID=UPI0035E78A1C|nr:hypothetical protein GCM10020241_16760 [Streptoalloteichus tenebrarius]
MRGAGWTNPPEYDGSGRVSWFVEVLTEREDSRPEIERFLCRVCDPLEYDDGMSTADTVRQCLNQILEPERLEVSYAGSRPVIGERVAQGQPRVVLEPGDVRERLCRWIKDDKAVELLIVRLVEVQEAEVRAPLLALFGIGSFIEGLLYLVLVERFPELEQDGFPAQNGKRVPAKHAGLELLLNIAHERNLIQLDAKSFMEPIRNFRNYIHLRRQRESDFIPDGDTVTMCWPPVQALLNDLDASATETSGV